MNKAELRRVYLEKRRALSTPDVGVMSRLITERLFDSFEIGRFAVIHCFISISKLNEIDTSAICDRIWTEFPAVRTVAPRVDRKTQEIVSVPYWRETPLVENSWGIREPAGDTLVEPPEIDAVLVPGLCLDRQGHRVGYGKGYYDKFLSQCRPDCVKIGLSLFEPVDEIDDIGPYDVALDLCITPETLIDFRSS
jgi:5-formyltetrahydrofolate cyclo-ligase